MTRPVDPAACRVVLTRHPNGALACIAIVMPEDRPLLAGTEAWGDDEIDRLLRLAREEEDSDPHSDQMPSDGALISAALRDLGIPIQGDDEDYYDAEGVSEARIQRAMAFGCEPPEEAPHHPSEPEGGDDDEGEDCPDWRDVPLLVVMDGTEGRLVTAGAFCDDNRDEPGLEPTLRGLVRGDVDWCRFGGGAAPIVQVVRAIENPAFDADALAALKRTIAKADAMDALLAAAKDAEAFMAGFEGDESQDPPVDGRLAALRSAIARVEAR